MRHPAFSGLLCAAMLVLGGTGHAVTIDWVTVGDPGNACDLQPQGCFGSVAQTYRIAKFETTNAQYAEFLNAVAVTDPHALYHGGMFGITQSGSSGSFGYSPIAGRENMPVNPVSFWDSLRFANWLHNGQPTGFQDSTTTEDGAYTMTPAGVAANSITRNAGATVFLTSEDEWYKAAYYDAVSTSYFDYPAGSNVPTSCTAPGATANTANCGWFPFSTPTDVGSYTGSASPNGTFDQGGNVWEWNESVIFSNGRGKRGGSHLWDLFPTPDALAASAREFSGASFVLLGTGFRVASIPEPGTALLLPLAGLALWRRQRAA